MPPRSPPWTPARSPRWAALSAQRMGTALATSTSRLSVGHVRGGGSAPGGGQAGSQKRR